MYVNPALGVTSRAETARWGRRRRRPWREARAPFCCGAYICVYIYIYIYMTMITCHSIDLPRIPRYRSPETVWLWTQLYSDSSLTLAVESSHQIDPIWTPTFILYMRRRRVQAEVHTALVKLCKWLRGSKGCFLSMLLLPNMACQCTPLPLYS